MELTAAIRALEALKKPCRVKLHTDSTYVRDGITKWIHGWLQNGWRTADRKPVKNADMAGAARRSQAAAHRMALGEGPQRPSRKRPRRRSRLRRGRRPPLARDGEVRRCDYMSCAGIASPQDQVCAQQRGGWRRLVPMPPCPTHQNLGQSGSKPNFMRPSAKVLRPAHLRSTASTGQSTAFSNRSMAVATSISSGAASQGSTDLVERADPDAVVALALEIEAFVEVGDERQVLRPLGRLAAAPPFAVSEPGRCR